MRVTRFFVLLVILLLGVTLSPAQPSLRPALASVGSTPVSSAGQIFADPQIRTEKKSVWVAIGYSLILPGLGELYADNFRTGRYYMGADAALWLTYAGLRTYGQWLRQDAQSFAVQNSGANFSGKGDQFSIDIGNFNNVNDYNDAKMRNRQFDLLYDPNSNFAWQWSSEDARLNYKHLRTRGDAVTHNSQFVIGALVINRIISAVSAVRAVSLYNRSVQVRTSWRLEADVRSGMLASQNLELTLTREF